MGDRVLMQCFSSKDSEFGPVVYCHGAGYRSPKIVRALAKRMIGCEGDLAYSSARLMQEALATYPHGNMSFGMWNATKLLTASESHGDAGIILIDVDNGHKCQCLGGYLTLGDDGFPVDQDED